MKSRVSLLLTLLGLAAWAGASTFTEPSTIFYGKVLGTGSGQPFQLHEGEIAWIVQTEDGSALELTAQLYSLNNGEYSYRLDVPHSVLALGLEPMTNSVPMGGSDALSTFPRIEVDGEEAHIVGGFDNFFFSAPSLRTSTYRLDLEIPMPSLDTDGDGLPDWWEDRYGLDKQDSGDAGLDGDGDGLTNLDEYRDGYDPTQDSRAPVLATTEQVVYADARNALLLTARDSDSAPADLTYTLLTLPAAGQILRVPGNTVINPGDSFSGADMLAGQVVYDHNASLATPVSLEVAVSDGDPEHAASAGLVWIFPYRPSDEALSSGMVVNGDVPQSIYLYLLASAGDHTVMDGTPFRTGLSGSSSSATEPMLFVSGPGADSFAGEGGDDAVVAGEGDDTATGGGGADRFLYGPAVSGTDTITDFTPGQGDVLDLTRLLSGSSEWLTDYVQVGSENGSAVLSIFADGVPGTPTTRIRLAGVDAALLDTAEWVAQGTLLVGPLRTLPRVFVEAPGTSASENGPTPASFVLKRTGDLSASLSVQFALGGVAVNGTDYSHVGTTASFAAGESEVAVVISPYTDSAVEPAEVVQLTLQPGPGYVLGTPAQNELWIEDLKIEVSLETLVSHAVQDSLQSGVILLKRSALVDQSVLVRLSVKGSAQAGSDYQSILPFVNLSPGQTSALIPVTPLSGAQLPANGATVLLTIVPDDAYRVGSASQAQVQLVEHLESLASWRSAAYPGETGSLTTFAAKASSDGGTMLTEYALGNDLSRPQLSYRDGQFFLDTWLRPDVADVELVVEFSDELGSWTTRPGNVKRIFTEETLYTPGMRTFELPGVQSLLNQYIRVRLVYQP